MYHVTKATPMYFINGKSHIKEMKSGKAIKLI